MKCLTLGYTVLFMGTAFVSQEKNDGNSGVFLANINADPALDLESISPHGGLV